MVYGLRKIPPLHSRIIIATLASFGLAGVLPISIMELQTANACPHFGPVAICHIVSIGYGLIFSSAVLKPIWKFGIFFIGWTPVFFLAANGALLELLGKDVCPKFDNDWPKCFFSLALACAIIIPVLLNWFVKRSTSPTNR